MITADKKAPAFPFKSQKPEFADLRSDTVTRPTQGMMQAMIDAPLGDDVFREDPSVNQLEEKVARMFGKEAAIFCPSGTMTNQIAIKAHTQPGNELICDRHAHIYINEAGGIAFNSGVQVRLIDGDQGRITATQVEANINAAFDWLPQTNLVCLENTVNRAGGSYYDPKEVKRISELCKSKQIPLHLDGARIFNALAETGETTTGHAANYDSISVCFSKGLGCPVGSALLGSKEFIAKARRVRKVLGGGMRQAGILASAAIYALDHHVARLKEDHTRAQEIAEVLKKSSFVEVLLPVSTNIVIFTVNDKTTAPELIAKLNDKGVKGIAFGNKMVRFVTHLDFNDQDLEKTIGALKSIHA